MIKASYKKYILNFKQPSGTSRGVLKTKETWFLILNSENREGIGECGLFRGLSVDDRIDYEDKLKWVCNNINRGLEDLLAKLVEFPSIQIGLEMAFICPCRVLGIITHPDLDTHQQSALRGIRSVRSPILSVFSSCMGVFWWV